MQGRVLIVKVACVPEWWVCCMRQQACQHEEILHSEWYNATYSNNIQQACQLGLEQYWYCWVIGYWVILADIGKYCYCVVQSLLSA